MQAPLGERSRGGDPKGRTVGLRPASFCYLSAPMPSPWSIRRSSAPVGGLGPGSGALSDLVPPAHSLTLVLPTLLAHATPHGPRISAVLEVVPAGPLLGV